MIIIPASAVWTLESRSSVQFEVVGLGRKFQNCIHREVVESCAERVLTSLAFWQMAFKGSTHIAGSPEGKLMSQTPYKGVKKITLHGFGAYLTVIRFPQPHILLQVLLLPNPTYPISGLFGTVWKGGSGFGVLPFRFRGSGF